ncbi:uncharacterized protein LOC134827403 [Culicoides brevitarsis]|uniref:uncharacterized protein LOC134827403 n=1 Tax=Culicoides brevitarsis TaxID=469753 RepID=UPI00307BCA26
METRASKRRRLTDELENIKPNINVDDKTAVIKKKNLKTPKTEIKTELILYEPSLEQLSSPDILDMKSLIRYFDGDDPQTFMDHCRKYMNSTLMSIVEEATIQQADTPIWHQMRLGRITASRIHQASRCKTKNGSLVDSIMGKKSGWSFAMQRGTDLEDRVFAVLKKELASEKLRQCGIFLDANLPHLAASPDGIAENFVVEIKCPATPKTHAEYLTVETLNPKYYGQIQLQMHITQRKKALLGVADLNFERNKKVTKVWIEYDEDYVKELIDDANSFWTEAVFPKLLKFKTKY